MLLKKFEFEYVSLRYDGLKLPLEYLDIKYERLDVYVSFAPLFMAYPCYEIHLIPHFYGGEKLAVASHKHDVSLIDTCHSRKIRRTENEPPVDQPLVVGYHRVGGR